MHGDQKHSSAPTHHPPSFNSDAAHAGPKTKGIIGRHSRVSKGQKSKPPFTDLTLDVTDVQYHGVRYDVGPYSRALRCQMGKLNVLYHSVRATLSTDNRFT
jgi:hypothetical protein